METKKYHIYVENFINMLEEVRVYTNEISDSKKGFEDAEIDEVENILKEMKKANKEAQE